MSRLLAPAAAAALDWEALPVAEIPPSLTLGDLEGAEEEILEKTLVNYPVPPAAPKQEDYDFFDSAEPPSPGRDNPPMTGGNLMEQIRAHIVFWEAAAIEWEKRGKVFKKQECQAAAAALKALL